MVQTRSGGQLAQGLADRHLARGRHLVQTVDQDPDHGFLHGSEAAERAEHVALERVEPAPLVLGQRAEVVLTSGGEATDGAVELVDQYAGQVGRREATTEESDGMSEAGGDGPLANFGAHQGRRQRRLARPGDADQGHAPVPPEAATARSSIGVGWKSAVSRATISPAQVPAQAGRLRATLRASQRPAASEATGTLGVKARNCGS